MPYNEEELEKKHKVCRNYWSFAYAKYCIEVEHKADEDLKSTYRSLVKTFNAVFNIKDRDKERIANAATVIRAAGMVHQDLKEIEGKKLYTRQKLEGLKEKSIDEKAKEIRERIIDYCDQFTSSYDRKTLARESSCLMEYLDAMYENPLLAAKVNIDDDRMKVAAKFISMGMIIKEGLEALEREYLDAVSPTPTLTMDQHKTNRTKIACMDIINDTRMKGDLLKEAKECQLVKQNQNIDRLKFAAIMADPEQRTRMSPTRAEIGNEPLIQGQPAPEINKNGNQ